MIFLVPLSKRCTGGQTIGEIFSSIKVHDVNIPDILMVVLCETLLAKDFLLERPHPQSAGTTKSQRRVGTRKRPPPKNHNQRS